jgi:oxygen-independent coproporphyrinogen-3 oxidase
LIRVAADSVHASEIPLSLYIHFPWCVRKCPYCDFNSHQIKSQADAFPEFTYVHALLSDLQQELPFVQGRKLRSIFFGGGTPSLMSGAAVATILQETEKAIGFDSTIEITLEANPGASEQTRFRDYRAAGVTRISLGAQSFDDIQLQKLGRVHRAEETHRAVEALRCAGFDNFNLDLMFALPGQTLDAAMQDLQQAIALSPTHLSWYQLTIEQNTVFYRERPQLPDDDAQFDILQAGQQLLREHGYAQYETSAYSQRGFQCVHNRNYWEFGDYLGIGAGAHGKVTHRDGHHLSIHRRQKTRTPEHYLHSLHPCCQNHAIPEKDVPLEFMLNALRLIDGVPRQLFSARTGLPFSAVEPVVSQLIHDDLLVNDPDLLAPTTKGALFLNDVVARFMKD